MYSSQQGPTVLFKENLHSKSSLTSVCFKSNVKLKSNKIAMINNNNNY